MIKISKKVLIPTIIFFVVFLYTTATIVDLKAKNAPSLDVIVTDSPIVFYFGATCPHCKIVEQYLTDNKVAQTVRFSVKEVYKNKDNASEAMDKAALCGIDKKKMGVPFLWDGEKCYAGDENIIDFFKAKMQEAPAAAMQTEDAISYYYGQNCPHCAIVDQFISENKVEEKVTFSRKEATQDERNRSEAIAKETACGISKETMGVPLLTVGAKCYMGEEQIINFFKEKLNEK